MGLFTAGLFYPTNTLLALDALGLDGNLYVWSHFALAASDERLYISCSRDGVNWFTLNGGNNVFAYPGYVAPTSFGSQSFGSVRDAAITYDGTQFVVVHTPCDSGVGCHSFRVLTSPDLINWTHIYDVPCPSGTTSGSGGYGNPVWITDTGGTVHVMFCGSTTGTITNSNCYVWEIHPSVAGVYTAWSTPSAITSLQYTAEINFFLSPDDSNYHVVKSNGNASGQIEEWACSTLTGTYTKTSTIGLNSQEGLNMVHLPTNGSAAEWRVYTEYGNGISTGYLYQDLTSGFVKIGGQNPVHASIVQRNGKFSVCRVPIASVGAYPTTGTLGAQDYDAATLASPTITGTAALPINLPNGALLYGASDGRLNITAPSAAGANQGVVQFSNYQGTANTFAILDNGNVTAIGSVTGASGAMNHVTLGAGAYANNIDSSDGGLGIGYDSATNVYINIGGATGKCYFGGSGTNHSSEQLQVTGTEWVSSTLQVGGAVLNSSAQTTVNGATSGSAVFSEPEQGSSYKVVMIYCNALLGAASYTFPVAFTHTPTVPTQPLSGIVSASTTSVTVTGTTSTGFVELIGY